MAYGDDARSRARIDEAQQAMNNQTGRSQGMIDYQQGRFNQQQNPLMQQMYYNYGQGAEQGMGDYTDIMNRYRQVYNAAGTPVDSEGGGGGGGGGGYGMVNPFLINVQDPFNSYKGYTEFSQTGGYSPTDVANMRARGVSPVRAAYANAQREIARQRSLQGGYSPGALTAMTRMAREQGQSSADAIQNVEAGLAQMRNQGRLAGLGGMSDIEKQRYEMDYKQQVYNAQAQASAAAQNASAAGANASASRAAAEADRADQLRALTGMTNLYGTTPGMAQTFGNQALTGLNTGAQFGSNMVTGQNQLGSNVNQGYNSLMQGQYNTGQMPGRTNQILDTIGRVGNMAGAIVDRFGRPSSTNTQMPSSRIAPGSTAYTPIIPGSTFNRRP